MISLILSVVVGLVVEAMPVINIALKPIIAALVIWGLGYGAIYALDQQSARDNYQNIVRVEK
jgi:hypothetical protein